MALTGFATLVPSGMSVPVDETDATQLRVLTTVRGKRESVRLPIESIASNSEMLARESKLTDAANAIRCASAFSSTDRAEICCMASGTKRSRPTSGSRIVTFRHILTRNLKAKSAIRRPAGVERYPISPVSSTDFSVNT